MNPLIAAAIIVSLVLVTTVVGVVWRARTGRVRHASGPVVTAAKLHTDAPLGTAATIVQFSTEYCGPCRIAERVLTGVAAERDGVAYIEVDLTAHPEAATEFGVMQTPTILLLNAAGGIR
ncbi:MAG: thioredoxin family protein, partial [Humibacter sp.]